jgi:hypothetical protein
MKIVIETIPHDQHRYETVGDYWRDEQGALQIRVSEMSDWRRELLVAFHELIEVHLTEDRGINEPDIKAFDEMFEAERENGLHGEGDEPGWDPRAPYGKEHAFSEAMERLLAGELKVDWKTYDKEVMSL